MAEIRTVTTLTRKAREIERTIADYEKRLAKARADLAHIRAIVRLFNCGEHPKTIAPYSDIRRLFRYGEAGQICVAALKEGPKSTQELGRALAEAKGFDLGDHALLQRLTHRAVNVMREYARSGKVRDAGRLHKPGRVRVWALP